MSEWPENEDDLIIGGAEVPNEFEWATERGEQKEAITTLKAEVALLRGDVSDIKKMLAENKGGVRMLLAVGGIAATLGAGMATLVAEWLRWMHGQQ